MHEIIQSVSLAYQNATTYMKAKAVNTQVEQVSDILLPSGSGVRNAVDIYLSVTMQLVSYKGVEIKSLERSMWTQQQTITLMADLWRCLNICYWIAP